MRIRSMPSKDYRITSPALHTKYLSFSSMKNSKMTFKMRMWLVTSKKATISREHISNYSLLSFCEAFAKESCMLMNFFALGDS
jgi:hypothetical protein